MATKMILNILLQKMNGYMQVGHFAGNTVFTLCSIKLATVTLLDQNKTFCTGKIYV